MDDLILRPGSGLPAPALVFAGACTLLAVVVSAMSIYLQLKNYHKPLLQRMVVRIMLMVPIYAVSSLIALFSLEAAFLIDAIRDVYEAFVIYCFFHLLLSYLGGERSLLILLHGRPPKTPVFPVNVFVRELDVSDPFTFLFLKRGILQYVYVKPILAFATLVLKSIGKFDEGEFRADSGYLYISIVYNISICLALYCLAMFWMCVHEDLRGFRPVPKFLCVKGVLFFSFWQSIFVSILVSAGVITSLGRYTSPSEISLGVTDLLISAEMPMFAFFHLYAFAYTDYLSPHLSYVARMPVWYAWKDAFGLKDVIEEAKGTFRGKGMDYREFEPSEGHIHQGVARERRIRAGLRYSKGGRRKYWLPRRNEDEGLLAGQEEAVAPALLQPDQVLHLAPDLQRNSEETTLETPEEDGYELPFGEVDDPVMEDDEELYDHSRNYLFGDYNYPCIDVSSEQARKVMWDEEERVLRDERGAWFSPLRGAKGRAAMEQRGGPAWEGYGAVGAHPVRGGTYGTMDQGPIKKGDEPFTIDHEQDRTPPVERGDLRLAWTKAGRTSSGSRPHSGSNMAVPGPSSYGGGADPRIISAKPAGHARSSPGLSIHDSRTPPHATVREDAVDLIVKDDELGEEKTTRERRKGEPAVRGKASGLRRVYGDGVEKGAAEEHQEMGDGAGVSSAATGLDEPPDDVEKEEDREGVVARVMTPPIHAVMDDNPWA